MFDSQKEVKATEDSDVHQEEKQNTTIGHNIGTNQGNDATLAFDLG
jgi:hypothetical protein